MKRTIRNYIDHKENMKLIRKLAWKFAQKTGLDLDDLVSEASFAYCQAIQRYDTSKGAKFSTFAYVHINNMLINYVKKESKRLSNFHEGEMPDLAMIEKEDILEIIEDWPEDCRHVVTMVLDDPDYYLGETPDMKRTDRTPKERLRGSLRSEGWYQKRITEAFKQTGLHLAAVG